MINFLKPVFYLRVSPERITIRNARTGESFSDTPDIAIVRDPTARILAIGTNTAQARLELGVVVTNPFGHPRSMVSDFTTGLQVFKFFIKKMPGQTWWQGLLPAPRVLIHLEGNSEGGYTQVEVRAFLEMGVSAGAGDVNVWEGIELSDAQVLSQDYPPGGKVLE